MEEMNEKLRRDVMRSLEAYGGRPVGDLPDMTEGERAKWLFWNLHENLEEVRQMEPTLFGRVLSTQLSVSDGISMWSEKRVLEKRLEMNCKWQMALTYTTYQDEQVYDVGEGWVTLAIGDKPPEHPVLQEGQKGYLHADHALYPNQLFLDGWVTEGVWQEIKPYLYSPNPTCRTDLLLMDSFLYPVKKGFDFVTGPAGCVGITNLEFRAFSHPTDRRMTRRSDTRQRG